MAKYIMLKFEDDKDGEEFLEDVQQHGTVPGPYGRHEQELPCEVSDKTELMSRLEQAGRVVVYPYAEGAGFSADLPTDSFMYDFYHGG